MAESYWGLLGAFFKNMLVKGKNGLVTEFQNLLVYLIVDAALSVTPL